MENLFEKYNGDLCKIISTSAFLNTTQLPMTDEQYSLIKDTLSELRKDLQKLKNV